ncbi:hypothetical protein K2Y00_03535 [Patescibacteria group bacterium]|nr:hypothetical protein [Patescibacteria group bacterium]
MTRSFLASLRRFGPLLLIVLLIAVVWAVMEWKSYSSDPTSYPEVQEIGVRSDWQFQELSTYFQRLADEKGALYAYEVLRYAPFPEGVDIHLLGHVVGDMLYEQQGIQGIHSCTQEFRNACSHSVVIGMLTEYGEGSLSDIAATCMEAPGGKGAYTMCFHGLGHGVLAFNGYDFEKAVGMCERTGTPAYNNREAHECIGGMMMEMIAGVHDREVWQTQVAQYFKKNDPLYPCNADFVPDEARYTCYSYLTPYLFGQASIDLDAPDPALYSTAFSYCEPLSGSSREACYGGFGKEFIVLANDRDIRTVGALSTEQLQKVHEWCESAGVADGEVFCKSSALASLFWGGESDPEVSFAFCALSEQSTQESCYRELGSAIRYYLGNTVRGDALCRKMPDQYRNFCSI